MNRLTISGFKCFKNQSFDINNLTIFTGGNGSGKSSVIQAILLIRLAIEKNDKYRGSSYQSTSWDNSEIPLNSGYELKLGTASDIFNDNNFTEGKISINLSDELYEIPLPDDKSNNDFVIVKRPEVKPKSDDSATTFMYKKEFYYLNTERNGPRLNLPINYTDFTHCGFKGEFTSQVLLKNEFFEVPVEKRHSKSKSKYLPQQVDDWLDEVCPGTVVRPKYLDALTSQIRLRNNSSSKDVLATNIGFGISYSLPIIVTGLIAEKGSAFIVENPEAHLHPKGQSNMGFFLAKVAAAGVKVILETHSEHVVNGIRRGMLSAFGLSAEDISMYFFDGFEKKKEDNVQPINISPQGDLTPFPVDFFDQVRQDLVQILKLSNR